MKFTSYYKFINENLGFTYGCVMAFTGFFDEFISIQNVISDKDLHEGGKEKEPHVTLLYGLHSDEINKEEIFKGIKEIDLKFLKLQGNLNIFEGENFDVLYFEIELDEKLREAHDFLKKFPHTNKFKDYKPHMTVAYLKPGLGKEYIKMFKGFNNEKPIEISRFVYSLPSGAKLDF